MKRYVLCGDNLEEHRKDRKCLSMLAAVLRSVFILELTGSELSMILSASATQMQNMPRKIYHKSKVSWLRMWARK
jgi:hypothetical protein